MTLDRVRVEMSTDRVPDDGVSVYLNIDGDIYDLPSLSRENHAFILSSLTNLSKNVEWYVTIKDIRENKEPIVVTLKVRV